MHKQCFITRHETTSGAHFPLGHAPRSVTARAAPSRYDCLRDYGLGLPRVTRAHARDIIVRGRFRGESPTHNYFTRMCTRNTGEAWLRLRYQERFRRAQGSLFVFARRVHYTLPVELREEHELSFPRPLLSVLVVSLQFVSRLATS